ncbi:apolipoprotein N-acyltransferase [Akkermansiaceae bacterium]|nr:apolipoprotein N-acyltransferase [Akkermansiaceae bacterium]
MRTFLRLFAAGASGLALALCFEPFNQDWLVWGWMWILLPIFWTTQAKHPRLAGFGLGYLSGFVFWSINLKWFWTVTGVGAVSIAAYLAIYFGIFGVFAARAGNPWLKEPSHGKGMNLRFHEMLRSLGYATSLAGLWCGLEWIRGWMLTGFGWNGLGAAFSKSLMLAQNAEFVGVIGLSFLPVFFSVVAVQVARRFYLQSSTGGVKLLHWDFASALLLIMSAFTLGTIRFTAALNAKKIEGRALLIQQDIPQFASRKSWEPNEVITGFMELTEQGIAEAEARAEESLKSVEPGEPVSIPMPDLVLWPEACLPLPFFVMKDGLRAGPQIESMINHVTSLGEFTLVSGVNELAGDFDADEVDAYNSLLIQGVNQDRQTFRKHHLVYFGEALPDFQFLRDLYKNATGVEFGGGVTSGENLTPLTLDLDGQKIGVIPSVCFEDTVPRLEREFIRNEPQVIINVTNDGWFQESEGSAQHFQNALFRAIELRRPMLRCANRGMTCVVSTTGSTVDPVTNEDRRLVDENGSLFHRGFILSSFYVPKDGFVTLYARFGDWFAVAGLIFAILWAIGVRVAGLSRLKK